MLTRRVIRCLHNALQLYYCQPLPQTNGNHFHTTHFTQYNHVPRRATARCYSDVPSTESDAVNINVGTIGHVDHGKTTLTAAITKVLAEDGLAEFVSYDEIDKAPEEKARGITINVAHIGYSTKLRHYAHTDCPGHADYVKNMISGTSQMDAAIVVVAADDGQMPQTREHLLLAKQIGLKKLIIYVNKADKADKEMLELVEIEMRELITDYGFDGINTPVISGSALLALNGDTSEYGIPSIRRLLDALDTYVTTPERDLVSPFLMPIDNAFTVSGRGTVVVGTLKQGTINKNSKCDLLGFNKQMSTTVGDIQIFKESVEKAVAGDHIGVLLRQLKIKSVIRGMLLCKADSQKLTNHFRASVYFLSKNEGGRKKPVVSNYCQHLFSGTWNVACRIDLDPGKQMIMPGENDTVFLTLFTSMAMEEGQPFTIRENKVTVATGIITQIGKQVEITKNHLGREKFSFGAK